MPTPAEKASKAVRDLVPSPVESREVSGDSQVISLPKTRIHTLDQLIEFCQVDLTVWEVERFICNKWEVGASGEKGLVVEPLYQIKAWLKRRKELAAARVEIEQLKKILKDGLKQVKSVRSVRPTGKMLEINIPDLHAGKMAWGAETGGGNYDTSLAVEAWRVALTTLLERVKSHEFEEVLFVVGNDLLHSDGTKGQTFGGTPLDNDNRYHKTFGIVRTLMIESIERLRKVAKVRVVMVPGNHDTLSVWHLGDSLECYFHKYLDVIIDNSPKHRKYHQFGRVMLGFTHGDKGKRQDYPLLMATEQPELFGATLFREMHTGHLHQTKLDEQHGVRVRVLPALCEPDAWHSEMGFVGAMRNAEAYVWSKDEGLIGMAIFSMNGRGK